MLNYDNWQILKNNLSAHRRECRVCRGSEGGCAPYRREFYWGKLSYLKWIEHWVEREHPEVERRRRQLEASLEAAHAALESFEKKNNEFHDRTTMAVREELNYQIDLAFNKLVLHYRS